MSNTYKNLQNSHPCFGGHKKYVGRIHLPVSPGCNIACRFCDRVINDMEERPGDTLATDYALETFRLIKEHYPDLIKCMSTNGLLLYEKAEKLIEIGIDSLTVTINAVDPEIEAKLNKYIIYHGKKYEGVDAAKILIENQLKGIRKVADAGITIKINTVLVPEINGDHIEEIAKTVKEAGASIYNIIPLIPQAELRDVKAPICTEIDKARSVAGKYIDVFRHCQHCRADAVGFTRYLSNDYSFTPVLVIISEPVFREEDKKRIIEEITLLIGSSNEREVGLQKNIQFITASFPINERLIFNRSYAGYRGSLTLTEDLYDNL